MQEKTLFVSRVKNTINEKELFQEFSYFGKIKSFRVIRHKEIAFVEMSTLREANNALLGLNGIEINGSVIRVERARPYKRSDSRDQ